MSNHHVGTKEFRIEATADCATLVLLHGRGSHGLSIASAFERVWRRYTPPSTSTTLNGEAAPARATGQRRPLRVIAPFAQAGTWYPYKFTESREKQDSHGGHFSGALARVASAVDDPARTVIVGFSQGACLTLEYVLAHPARYGGVMALSGCLLDASEDADTAFASRGGISLLQGTPALVAVGDADSFLTPADASKAAQVLEKAGAKLIDATREGACVYPHMQHVVSLAMPRRCQRADKAVQITPHELDVLDKLLDEVTRR